MIERKLNWKPMILNYAFSGVVALVAWHFAHSKGFIESAAFIMCFNILLTSLSRLYPTSLPGRTISTEELIQRLTPQPKRRIGPRFTA